MRVPVQRFICLVLLFFPLGKLQAAEPSGEFAPEQIEYFEKQVRPLLVEHCFECHSGPKVKGGLSLTSRAGAIQGGDTGPAVVPGKLDEGELLAALKFDPNGYQMPPAGKLREDQIAVFRKWIEMGAPWPAGPADGAADSKKFDLAARADFWSFRRLSRPEVPGVSNEDWCRTPVDRFILAKLDEAKLTPASEADRATWLRRVTLDVIGLPPTPEEVEAFLADDMPGAHERVVDRLLANPHFGERWGRHWLDLVRYAESRGHEFDYSVANPWHYRDYIIRATNDDVPYDQFVAEHIAGDMLTNGPADKLHLRVDPVTGRNESILGTGFWCLGEWVHSPVDIRQEEADRFDNMIDVYSKTFLGLTVACARCHDHKFDPILQRDFYALQGYLQSSTYRQARFETMLQEEAIGRELIAIRSEAGAALLKSFAELAEPTTNDMDKYLLAARSVLEEGVALKREVEDAVFADFESGTYDGWTTTGDAFGTGPVTLADLPDYQGKINAVGKYFVNSHLRRDGGQGDRHTGTLTSDPFTIRHRYIRFWIGGGGHAGKTCVNLLVDGKPLRSTAGPSNNQMVTAEWDVADLIGQTARMEVVDNEQGGWGNIGIDQVVFSDRSPGGERAMTPADFAPGMQRRLVTAAQEFGVHVSTLSHWVAQLASDPRPGDPLAQLLQSTTAPNAVQNDTKLLDQFLQRDNVELIADFRNCNHLVTDGPLFTTGMIHAGEPVLNLDGEQPVSRIETFGGVSRDRFWDGLITAAGTIGDAGSTEGWQRGGRMLQTDSFTISQPKLFALVRGGCRSYASVDSHITIRGPLHGSLTRDHANQPDWHWIEHDVSRYTGHRAHLEFIPKEDEDFTVALVVQTTGDLPPAMSVVSLQATTPAETGDTVRHTLRLSVEAAIHLMHGDHTVSATDPHLLNWANWMLVHPQLVGMDADNLARWHQLAEPYRQRYLTLKQQAQLESHTAPCLLAGTPEDEYVFIRGNWKKQGETASRSFLTVFEGEQSNGDQLSNHEAESRLALAQKMVDPQRTPVLARVIVNRIWLHYFGRGIVPTPDDFGHLGQLPSHPELLDWLASELVAHDWSLKHVHRLILESAAYRMTSDTSADPQIAQVDPQNVLLHRMNLKRMEGEIIRDSMLALSGRFDSSMYGESVPIHLNEFLEGRGRPASGPVDGNGRRSLYLSIRRNFLEPFFQAFDFPVPHTTTGRRAVSNVPAQALALMNNDMVTGQSQVWADQLLKAHPNVNLRVQALYEAAYGRSPTESEQSELMNFLQGQADEYKCSSDDVRVWTDACQIIWNSKEFVFIR